MALPATMRLRTLSVRSMAARTRRSALSSVSRDRFASITANRLLPINWAIAQGSSLFTMDSSTTCNDEYRSKSISPSNVSAI